MGENSEITLTGGRLDNEGLLREFRKDFVEQEKSAAARHRVVLDIFDDHKARLDGHDVRHDKAEVRLDGHDGEIQVIRHGRVSGKQMWWMVGFVGLGCVAVLSIAAKYVFG
jgi:hypothetical protein